MAIEAMPLYSPGDGYNPLRIEQFPINAAPVVVEVTENVKNVDPIVRSATQDDVNALTDIELSAYADVYGSRPDETVKRDVQDKYTERVELLGDWIRVLEHPDRGVYGMMVCCPTSLGREDFMAEDRDLTNNDTVRAIYNAEGENAYVVNLAVKPEWQGQGDHFRMFADAIQIGMAAGIKRTYFESRLPGFDRWAERQYENAIRAHEEPASLKELAEEYWQLRVMRDGELKPKDPLLRLYTDFGCEPLKLIQDAWKPDTSSKGFGVLCEFTVPINYDLTEERPGAQDELTEVQESPEDKIEIGFAARTVEWARRHKKKVLLGATALAGVAYTIATGGEQEIIDGAKENASWAIPAYAASLITYFGGVAIMLAGAGQKARNFLGPNKQEMSSIGESLAGSQIVKTGFLINAAGAVSSAAVASAAVIESLPPTAWTVLSVPLADLFSTLVVRSWIYDRFRKH